VNKKTDKAEEAVRKGDIKELYNITGKLSKRKYQDMQPIKNSDGVLLANENGQMKRQQKYFVEILNPTLIDMIPTTSSPLSSPTDRCDNEAEEEEEGKTMERTPNKDDIKKLSKQNKILRPQVWTISHPNC
jgi:hypothetical protein